MDKTIPIFFKIKSTKGQDVTINYKPEDFKVADKKEFEGYLLRIVDLIQCTGYGVPKPKEKGPEEAKSTQIKGIEEVAGEVKTAEPVEQAVAPINKPKAEAKEPTWEGGLFDDHTK